MTLDEGVKAQIWSKPPGDGSIKFPQLDSNAPLANFLGVRVENLLKERYPKEVMVYFELSNGEIQKQAEKIGKPEAHSSTTAEMGSANEAWYHAAFRTAYIQNFIPPGPNDRNYMSLNFKNPAEVQNIRAWINGKEILVEQFRYFRAPERAFNYYLDGSRAGLKRGDNSLTLYVRYKSNR
jgi:hypothetical protein